MHKLVVATILNCYNNATKMDDIWNELLFEEVYSYEPDISEDYISDVLQDSNSLNEAFETLNYTLYQKKLSEQLTTIVPYWGSDDEIPYWVDNETKEVLEVENKKITLLNEELGKIFPIDIEQYAKCFYAMQSTVISAALRPQKRNINFHSFTKQGATQVITRVIRELEGMYNIEIKFNVGIGKHSDLKKKNSAENYPQGSALRQLVVDLIHCYTGLKIEIVEKNQGIFVLKLTDNLDINSISLCLTDSQPVKHNEST